MDNLITEVAQHLHNQGIGVLGTSLFRNYLPDRDSSFAISVIDTGGVEPDIDLPTKEPTFQIYIYATTYSVGKAKLTLVRSALHQKYNTQLVPDGNFYFYINAISEGGYLGRDEKGRDLFSMNFRTLIR